MLLIFEDSIFMFIQKDCQQLIFWLIVWLDRTCVNIRSCQSAEIRNVFKSTKTNAFSRGKLTYRTPPIQPCCKVVQFVVCPQHDDWSPVWSQNGSKFSPPWCPLPANDKYNNFESAPYETHERYYVLRMENE